MDETTSQLRRKIEDGLAELSDEQMAALIQDARDEALTEVKAFLKDTMVQAILERTLGELEGETKYKIQSPKLVLSPVEVSKSDEQIQQEIEAIRRKIAENERLLSQVKASPIETEEVQEPPREEEKGCGHYVYGIVGDDGSQPEGLPEKGIDSAHPVYALPYRAIQAVVSEVSLQEFGQEALEANLEDIKWVEAKVLAHQRVLEAALDSHTLVPMRFCTIYQSEGRVQEMLAQHYDDFVEALARLEGKQEWGVKVYCDGKALAQRVGETSDRVKELKAEMEQKSRGAAYFLKKKVDEAIAEEVERVSDEYAQRSHDGLSSHAEEAVINPLQSKEFTGRKEAMILNGAYLVAEEQLTAFRAELESLEEEYSDLGFVYEMTGPWPPYNFVSIGLEESAAHE
ncbi:MAG: GvpL/GvpF family gas vesicle protein [Anaerolineales bacterium]|nr:GvpL/GvpF family gas vesicle protein [Anaerolineales bacterium]